MLRASTYDLARNEHKHNSQHSSVKYLTPSQRNYWPDQRDNTGTGDWGLTEKNSSCYL